MKKIPSLFARNYEGNRLVRDEIVPGAEWVVAGEGVATRKFDGVCTMIRGGALFRRYALSDEQRAAGKVPAAWEPADERDPITGKQVGWIPVGATPGDRYMREAMCACVCDTDARDGTYEFLGPKSQDNVERIPQHRLVPHGDMPLYDAPRTFEALREYLAGRDIEGIVWHHPDGRRVKIKTKDFGLQRGAKSILTY